MLRPHCAVVLPLFVVDLLVLRSRHLHFLVFLYGGDRRGTRDEGELFLSGPSANWGIYELVSLLVDEYALVLKSGVSHSCVGLAHISAVPCRDIPIIINQGFSVVQNHRGSINHMRNSM